MGYLATTDGPRVYVLATVEASGETRDADRAPVNLCLAIDRSSSMRGPRISQACAAAQQLVERLDQRDRIGLVTFDASARITHPATRADEAGRKSLLAALDAVETGIGTNLAAGLKKAADVVASGFVRDAVSRVVLLTDGQPSVGITDGERLARMGEEESKRGINTTTMGIGESFDDELLTEIARRSGGGFYYLSTPEAIPGAFGAELQGVFSVAATAAELKLMPAEDIVSVEVLHRLPARPSDDGLVVSMGDLACGPPRHVLFKLHREPGAQGRRVARLTLTYRNRDGSAGDGHILGIELPEMALSADRGVIYLERLRLEVAAAVDEAWARRASGDRHHALASMQVVKKGLLAARDRGDVGQTDADELLTEISLAEDAIARSAAEREKARRTLRERSHLTLIGRSQIRPLPSPDGDDD